MNSTAINTIILMGTTFFAKMLGFGRELSLAFVHGASIVSDAYFVAFSIPTIIFSGIGSAILTCYIPIYTSLEEKKCGEERTFTNQAVTVSFLLSAVIVLFFRLLDDKIIRCFAVGFDKETFALAVRLSDIMILSILFISIYFVLEGYLQVRGKFFAVGMVSVPLNIAVIASILYSSNREGILGWGVVLGYFLSFAMLFIAAKRAGFSYRPDLDFRNSQIPRLLTLVFPIFIGKAITELNTMIDRSIASMLPHGGVSALSYANRIIGFITSVFVVSVATALFPQLARLSAQRDHKQLKRSFIDSAGVMSLLVLPIGTGSMIFSRQVVEILFQRGAFTAQDTWLTARVVFCYGLGLVFFSLKDVTLNVFYALQDTRTPTGNSLLALLLNTVFNLLFIKPMGACGLALATSLSSGMTLAILLWKLRRKIGCLGLRMLAGSLWRMVAASAGMAAVLLPLQNLLEPRISMVPALLVSVAVGAVVYGIINFLLRTREMEMVFHSIRGRIL